jgi:hypothetical protein
MTSYNIIKLAAYYYKMAAYYYKMAAYYYKMTYVIITICFPGQQYSSVCRPLHWSLISRLYKTSDESEDLSQRDVAKWKPWNTSYVNEKSTQRCYGTD